MKDPYRVYDVEFKTLRGIRSIHLLSKFPHHHITVRDPTFL
jgi:hypothetical protein